MNTVDRTLSAPAQWARPTRTTRTAGPRRTRSDRRTWLRMTATVTALALGTALGASGAGAAGATSASPDSFSVTAGRVTGPFVLQNRQPGSSTAFTAISAPTAGQSPDRRFFPTEALASAAASTYTFPRRGDTGPITGTGTASDLCLTATNTAAGMPVVMQPCDGSGEQDFTYRDVTNQFVGTGVMLVPAAGRQGIGGYDTLGGLIITAAGAEDRFLLEGTTLIPSATASVSGAISDGFPHDGDEVAWSVVIENDGDLALSDLVVVDSSGTEHPCDAQVLPGDSATCRVTQQLTQVQVDAGATSDTFVVRTTTADGDAYELAPASATVPLLTNGAGTTYTTVQEDDLGVGDELHVTATASNTGNVTLNGVAVTVAGQPTTCAAITIAPQATETCAITHTVTQTDVDAGRVVFTTEGTGSTPAGRSVDLAPSEATVSGVARPSTELEITTTVDGSDAPGVGAEVGLRAVVRNSGNVTLTDVAVAVDDREGFTVTCPAGPLAPAGEVGCRVDGTATVTQPEVDAGKISFAAKVTGTTPSGAEVTATATADRLTIAPAPAITETVTATAPAGGPPAAGAAVAVTITVTNSGNVTLHDVDAAVDGSAGRVVCASTTLVPRGSTDCTTDDHVLTQTEINAGQIDITATATATAPDGTDVTATAETTMPITRAPSITTTVTAHLADTNHDAPRTGDAVHTNATLTNTGNTTLTTVGATLDDGTTLDCTTSELTPDTTTDCTTDDHVLTQTEINAGQIDITATATATAPDGTDVTAEDRVTMALDTAVALDLTAEWTPSRTGVLRSGDTIAAEYRVVNTSNVTLTSTTVTDPAAGAITCDVTELEPGAATRCTADAFVKVTDGVAEAGTIRFDAVATASDPSGDEVRSNEATKTFDAGTAPSAAPPSAPVLAFTGAAGTTAATIGAGALVLAGLALMTERRRRRMR